MSKWIAIALVTLATLAPMSAARADPYVSLGIGPTVNIDDWPTQVRLEQEIGYSFSRRSGFFISFAPSQSFNDDFWMLVFPIGLGGMFDVYSGRDVTFQLGPMGTAGFGLLDDFDRDGRDTDLYFHFSVAFQLRLLFRNGFGIYIKPVSFEFGVGDSYRGGWGGFHARYYAAGGIAYYF